MDNHTHFDSIGKRMPYRTPEGFFESQAEQLLKLAAQKEAPAPTIAPRKGISIGLGWWIGTAAAVVTLAAVTLLKIDRQHETPQPLYAYNEAMSSDELADWIEFYEADLFLAE